MIVPRPGRRRRLLGDDLSTMMPDFFPTDTTDTGASLDSGVLLPAAPDTATYTPPSIGPIALLPTPLTSAAPGLSPYDLLPSQGTISVTSEGNVINSTGQILGIVDPSSSKVIAEPGVTPQTAGTTGGTLDVSGLAANVAKAVSSLFGTTRTTGTPLPGTPSTIATGPGATLAGIPSGYLILGGLAVIVLAASGGSRRR